MARLNLVVADTDKGYIEGLVGFLMSSCSQQFQVNSFTNQEFLLKFLAGAGQKIDILLVSPEIYSESLRQKNIGSIVLLCGGKASPAVEGVDTVNKYQRGDRLMADILNILSERQQNEIVIPGGGRQTRVVCVYSPSGGTGKTCVAVSASIQCSLKGLTVFYLNLESIQTTPLFFRCDGAQNLSNILYYLKEKNKNLALKIEGVRMVDPSYHVHYFSPPDRVTEMEEMTPEEICLLVNQMKSMGQYDVIFVDMSPGLDRRNMALLEACDEICLVTDPGTASGIKAQSIARELDILAQKDNLQLQEKLTVVLNKCSANTADGENAGVGGKSVSYRLPLVRGLEAADGAEALADTSNPFAAVIYQMIGKYEQ